MSLTIKKRASDADAAAAAELLSTLASRRDHGPERRVHDDPGMGWDGWDEDVGTARPAAAMRSIDMQQTLTNVSRSTGTAGVALRWQGIALWTGQD